MRYIISSILLCSCALGVSAQAQSLPKLSDMGLAPVASATFYCEEEDFSLSLQMAYENGRMSQFIGQSSESEVTVQFDPLQMTLVSEYLPEVVYKDIVLNEAGCATSWTTCLGTREFQGSACYNEKNQLLSIQLEEGESCTLTWEDDNVTHLEYYDAGQHLLDWFDITYSDQPSHGLIVHACTPSFDEFGFFAFSGLMGVTSKNLPLQMVDRWDNSIYCDTSDYDYEYDEQGRVTCVKTTLNERHTDYRHITYAEDASHLNAIMSVGTPCTRKTTQGIVRTLSDGTQRVYDYLGR